MARVRAAPKKRAPARGARAKTRPAAGGVLPGGMFRVALKLLLAAAAVAAVWCFVPVKGRTLAERWGRARTPTEFVERAWSDVRGPPAPAAARPRPPARGSAQARGAPAQRPTESHSEADRKALDRVLSQHLQD
jgi:hypothetical protein